MQEEKWMRPASIIDDFIRNQQAKHTCYSNNYAISTLTKYSKSIGKNKIGGNYPTTRIQILKMNVKNVLISREVINC